MDEKNVLLNFRQSMLRNTELLADIIDRIMSELDLERCEIEQCGQEIILSPKKDEKPVRHVTLSIDPGNPLTLFEESEEPTLGVVLTVDRNEHINHFGVNYFASSDEFSLCLEDDNFEENESPFEQSDIDFISHRLGELSGGNRMIEHRDIALAIVGKLAQNFAVLTHKLQGGGCVIEGGI